MQGVINWTPRKVKRLMKQYHQQREIGAKDFVFIDDDGKEYTFVTDYAKYLLEYLVEAMANTMYGE